jgi:hypothetical protein
MFVVAAVHRDSPRHFRPQASGRIAIAAWAACIRIAEFARAETDDGQYRRPAVGRRDLPKARQAKDRRSDHGGKGGGCDARPNPPERMIARRRPVSPNSEQPKTDHHQGGMRRQE